MKKTIPFLLIIILLVGIMGACNINKDSKPLEGKKYSEKEVGIGESHEGINV